jgi:hypothetical protein
MVSQSNRKSHGNTPLALPLKTPSFLQGSPLLPLRNPEASEAAAGLSHLLPAL